MNFNITDLAWEKMQGLLPAIVQDINTGTVLMLGYMNEAALHTTVSSGWVTFYSRSKNRLWTKGETSGNKLAFIDIKADCDQDTLLILAKPTGPTCHNGTVSCFNHTFENEFTFIQTLENTIHDRKQTITDNSYTSSLFQTGINKIAQKVGEEAVEVVIAALAETDKEFCAEVADLVFHLLVLLKSRELSLMDVIKVLQSRHKAESDMTCLKNSIINH